MAQEFWSDKPLTITISGKSPNNSGIPKIDITGEKGIICGPSITSTTTSLSRQVSNSAAASSADSVSTKFYASCEWDNPRTLATDVNTYGNLPGCGKSKGNIKVKVWWDSVKKGDSSDDTYVEQTISDVTIKNAVETIDITGLSYSNGNPIPFKNGAYALDGYNEYNGIYVNYRLKGEYHESNVTSSTNLTYMPIYDSTVKVSVNNTYFDTYTYVTPGTAEQYIINGKYFIPTKFNESTSAASTGGSIGAGSIGGDIVVGPGDTIATPFPSGTFQITLQALGGYKQPSTAVTLDVAGLEQKLIIESFTFSDSTQNKSGMPNIVFGNGIDPAHVNVSYSGVDVEVNSDTGQITSNTLTKLFEDSVHRYKIGEVTATCTFGTQTVEQTVDVYMAASIVSYIKFTPIGNGTDRVRIVLNSGNSTPAITSVPIIYYSSTTGKNFQQAEVTNNGQWYEFSKERPMYIYGFNPRGFSKEENLYVQFQFDGPSKFNISGNIMGLIDGFSEVTAIPSLYCFYRLFMGISLIYDISALRLPATSLQISCYREMFKGCNSITAAPELPAMATKNYCYESMFMGCTSLISAPELPATTTTLYCYQNMFNGCSALVNGPTILPATKIIGAAYYSMFEGCTSLKNAPYIAGTDNSGWGGTASMFKGCKSLVECPEFSFEKVGPSACREMFMNCYELINAPKILPATTLADNCYTAMFYNCYKIRFAPELPAKNLIKECYHTMFAECHSLRYVKALFTTNITKDTNYTYNWLYKVNTTGVVVKAVDAKWSLSGESGIPANWEYAYNYSNNEMEIVNTLYEYNNGQFSCDSLAEYIDTESLVEPNIIILYRNINGTLPKNSFTNAIETIVISPYIQSINEQAFVPKTIIGDKAMHLTLVDMRDAGKETGADVSYLSVLGERAFAGNNALKRVFLPYSINKVNNDIFYGCSQLTEIWYDGTIEEYNENIGTTEFGASINAKCKIICTDGDIVVSSEPDYQGDYLTLSALEDGEITITISSEVGPSFATYLSYSKDKSVWERTDINGENKTITIPVSRGDNVYLKGKAKQWYNQSDPGGASIDSTANINVSGNIMSLLYEDNFEDKTVFPDNSNHTFSWLFGNNKHLCSAEKLILPATLTDYCYHFMFYGCSSLTQAPELPATTLTDSCYRQMFKSCTKLTQASELPATTLASSCYYEMFFGCSSLTQAPELPATTLAQSCYESMFYGCSSLTQAPELPATTLTDYYYCYNYMFSGCNKLNYIKALFTTTPDESYTCDWLSGVSTTGTFVKNSAATWTKEQAGIPTGWTVQTA